MNRLFLTACLIFSTLASAQQDQGFRAALSKWEGIVDAQSENASGGRQAAFAELNNEWDKLTRSQQEADWPLMAMAYIDRSEAELAQGVAQEAARSLHEAGELYKDFQGRLEYATKSPVAFFERLSKLQASIAQETGSDPLSGLVDYLFRKNGNRYIVARQEQDAEVNGVTLDGIADSEALALVHELTVQNKRVSLQNTRWLIGPKGNVAQTIDGASREVLFDAEGRLLVEPIRINNGADASTKPLNSTADIQPAKPGASPKQPAQEPSLTGKEEPSSSYPWLAIGAVVVAAIIIVWLLLKMRK